MGDKTKTEKVVDSLKSAGSIVGKAAAYVGKYTIWDREADGRADKTGKNTETVLQSTVKSFQAASAKKANKKFEKIRWGGPEGIKTLRRDLASILDPSQMFKGNVDTPHRAAHQEFMKKVPAFQGAVNVLKLYMEEADKPAPCAFVSKAPKDESEEDTEEKDPARKKATALFDEAMAKPLGDPPLTDKQEHTISQEDADALLKASSEKLDAHLATITAFREGKTHSPADNVGLLCKLNAAESKCYEAHAKTKLAVDREKSKRIFADLITETKVQEASPPLDEEKLPDMVKALLKTGDLTKPEKPADKPLSEQLADLEKKQDKALVGQKDVNTKAAIAQAQKRTDDYFKETTRNAHIAYFYALATPEVRKACFKSSGEADLSIGNGSTGLQLVDDPLVAMAKANGGRLSGAKMFGCDVDLLYHEGDPGSFSVDLSTLSEGQMKVAMAGLVKATFASQGPSPTFWVKSTTRPAEKGYKEVQQMARMIVENTANMPGADVEKIRINGQDEKGNPCVFAFKADPGGSPPVKAFSSCFADGGELRNLLATNNANTKQTASEAYKDAIQDIKREKEAPEPGPEDESRATLK